MFLSQSQLIITTNKSNNGSKAAKVKKTEQAAQTVQTKAAKVKKTEQAVQTVQTKAATVKKTTKKTTSVSKTTSVREKTIEHIQLAGQGIYDDGKYFRFEPEDSDFGVVKPFKGNGSIQLLSDGTLDVVRTIRKKSLSTLIKKLPHGRLSKTMAGAIQLTIKDFLNEKTKINNILLAETAQASSVYADYEKANTRR